MERVNAQVARENLFLREDVGRLANSEREMRDRLRMLEARMGGVEVLQLARTREVIDLSDDLSEYDLGSPAEEEGDKENRVPLESRLSEVLVPDVLDQPLEVGFEEALAPAQREGTGLLQEIVERFEGTVAGVEFGEAGWLAIDSLYN